MDYIGCNCMVVCIVLLVSLYSIVMTNFPPGSGDLYTYLQFLFLSKVVRFLFSAWHHINSNDQVRGYAGDYTRTAAPVGWDLYFPKVQIPTFPYLSPCMW